MQEGATSLEAGLEVTILIATRNRCDDLRRTLEAMTRLRHDGLALEIVVIDNQSKDATREVARSFDGRLPLRYLFAPDPGKNRALNLALASIPLGRIVVFTDDDVDPAEDWLFAIRDAVRRHPDCKVFGGKSDVLLPEGPMPAWTTRPDIQRFAFSRSDFGSAERPYDPGAYPAGANFWVTRDIFASGRKFNESVGPAPGHRIMGSETTLLKQLRGEGQTIMYCPSAVIKHRVQRELVSEAGVRRKAQWLGRQGPHLHGLPNPGLLRDRPLLWKLRRLLSLSRGWIGLALATMSASSEQRFLRSLFPLELIAYNLEALNLATRERSISKTG